MEKENDRIEYELHDGLFGQTDRNSGEYHFKSGNTEQIYTNADYIPVNGSASPPKYYKPASSKEDNVSEKKKVKINRGLAALVGLCLLCALAGGTTGAVIMHSLYSKADTEKTVSAEELVFEGEQTDEVLGGTKAYTDEGTLNARQLYAQNCSQVVSVNTERYTTGRDGVQIPSNISGTGFFISSDGYVMTNYHVVEEAYRKGYPVNVTTNTGDILSGTVAGFDSEKDIALLKVSAGDLNVATLGNSSEIQVGEDIFIIGNPYGVLDFTLTSGHVGGPIRQVDSSDNGIPIEMFQLDAEIYEGNSGGPVYNDRGEVVGVVTAMYSEQSDMGIGFAIPINDALEVAEDIINRGYTGGKASLGVDYFDKYNTIMANFYELPSGAYVMNVWPGSCAERAGIERGDIIVQIGNIGIYGHEDCEEMINQYSAGDTASFVIYRDSINAYEYLSVTFDEASS